MHDDAPCVWRMKQRTCFISLLSHSILSTEKKKRDKMIKGGYALLPFWQLPETKVMKGKKKWKKEQETHTHTQEFEATNSHVLNLAWAHACDLEFNQPNTTVPLLFSPSRFISALCTVPQFRRMYYREAWPIYIYIPFILLHFSKCSR